MTWTRWQPTAEQPWNLRRAVHLHRRAGFGATWDQIQRDLADGPDAAIDRVLNGPEDSISATLEGIGHAAVGSGNPERLKAWWLLRMLRTPHPLREKLTLMWHNHFATSNAKVRNLEFMRRQNVQLLTLGYGHFAELLNAVARDPALLMWLDAPSNRKGRPNENLAREIMELFTLGVGNYSETDVREAARALTGWSLDKSGAFAFVADAHDHGNKTILGETGPWNGHDLLRILLAQNATAERIAWRLCSMLMGEDVVSASQTTALAEHIRSAGLSIRAAVETILRSEEFFADENIGTRVASPVEFVVSAVLAAELNRPLPETLKLARWTTELGQDLFYPPNVGGWTGGRNWLSTRYIVARANFAATLCDGGLSRSLDPPDFRELLKKRMGDASVRNSISWFDNVLLGGRLPPASRQLVLDVIEQEEPDELQQLKYAPAVLLSLPEFQES